MDTGRGVLVVGLGALIGLIGLFEIPLHIYSALVIPVLIGISVDEAMFLLHHARGADEGFIRRTLELETRPVVTTALTTSAGLFALCFAKYDGLRHLGSGGAVGNAPATTGTRVEALPEDEAEVTPLRED